MELQQLLDMKSRTDLTIKVSSNQQNYSIMQNRPRSKSKRKALFFYIIIAVLL